MLSPWWRPAHQPESEARCYLQIAGWFPPPAELAPSNAEAAIHAEEAPESVLRRVFGFHELRPLQKTIIDQVLRKAPTLAVIPTGGGKSLCYQLPALLVDGLTVVVSPLIALMQDQVEQLQALAVAAAFLNSTLTYAAQRTLHSHLRQGAIKLLYVAPETLVKPDLLALLDECRVVCVAVDEAHCISEWGHDFRPEYRQLAGLRQRFGRAAWLALTATAAPRVQRDIETQLRLDPAATVVASFDRPNLLLAVDARADGFGQSLAVVRAHPGQSGIIYCTTQRQVEEVAARLVKAGVAALPYHAGLDSAVRAQNQRRWLRDDAQVMVATIAFGMGINKPDVRFVLHYNLPQDLESYYQQVGRAGRDGLPADCLLLLSYADVYTIRRFIEEGAPEQKKGRQLRLDAMIRWAEATGCRRQPLLAYFGEVDPPAQCGRCDNCLAPASEQQPDDLTEAAKKFLSCVLRTGERFGVSHVIQVLRGSLSEGVTRRRHEQLSTWGIGKEYDAAQWKYLAEQFLRQNLVAQHAEQGNLAVTGDGRAVLKGERTVAGKLRAAKAASVASGAGAPALMDAELMEHLRRWRKAQADLLGVPPYVIFHDRSLQQIASVLPHSAALLGQLHGVGQRKLEQWGDEILALVRSYCAERGLAERPLTPETTPLTAPPPEAGTGAVSTNVERTVELLRTLGSLSAVVETLRLRPSTILRHLHNYVSVAGPLPVEPLLAASALSPEEQQAVLAQFQSRAGDALSPLFEHFGGRIAYDELHLLRLVYLSRRTAGSPSQ
jgi:ATP-dependent DNA helicase RecQ